MTAQTITLSPAGRSTAAPRRLPPTVYVRRRLLAAGVVVLVVLFSVVLARAASVALADRGSVPASASTVRSGDVEPSSPETGSYIVQPGDTLWAIAERFHREASLTWYVDTLVALAGSATIQPGQRLVLP